MGIDQTIYIYVNRENLPGHFKFKEYCPRVFHNLRKRFEVDDYDYMVSYYISVHTVSLRTMCITTSILNLQSNA